MRKKYSLLGILLAFIMVFQMSMLAYAAASVIKADCVVPADAEAYANAHYRGALQVVEEFQDAYEVSDSELEGAKLGCPFVIYEPEKSVQDEIYYYPILDAQDNIVLLMSIMGTTQGWNLSISEEWVDGLQQMGDITTDVVFYKTGDVLYAENKRGSYVIAGEVEHGIRSFQCESYESKKQHISEINTRFVKADTENIELSDTNRYDGYAPAFSTSTSSSKICALYNKQLQGSYNLCWAASVATICNYLNGTNVTAKNVADKMGIGYNTGAGLYEAQAALSRYGVTYNNYNASLNAQNRMSWNELKTNINNKYPVYVAAKPNDPKRLGHAVTAYGYSVAAGSSYVVMWNSGSGASMTLEFKATGTTFAYDNDTYTWTYSVSKY